MISTMSWIGRVVVADRQRRLEILRKATAVEEDGVLEETKE
jgi:hypothetical protein